MQLETIKARLRCILAEYAQQSVMASLYDIKCNSNDCIEGVELIASSYIWALSNCLDCDDKIPKEGDINMDQTLINNILSFISTYSITPNIQTCTDCPTITLTETTSSISCNTVTITEIL